MLTKLKNKTLGYHCDSTKIVPKIIFTNGENFFCEEAAIKKFGAEMVKEAVFEED